ncbi:MAG: carboxypeptidase regulatory-like domain-containing protein [Terracidiphilus sp.]|nr:carboxypeptidase regulatory-like domain-containing protein [Terracidiphilus sp.]
MSIRFSGWALTAFLLLAGQAGAQSAKLRGQVRDESGAAIAGATITAADSAGHVVSTVSLSDGSFAFKQIQNGHYRIEASFPGFTMKSAVWVVIDGRDVLLNLTLKVSTVVQNVTVEAQDSATVSVDSSNNASSVVLSGSRLDSLADNPDDMASDLQALAGPSAGPNGGSLYIDGFSTGEMPPKESIREIRINQNPFSSEYDSLGLGRIEIFTKPGSGQFHGSAFFNIGSDVFNSRNPYAAVKAPFLLREYGTSLAGPLTRRSSFTLDARGDATTNGAVINGAIVDPASLAIVSPYSSVYEVAQHRYLLTPSVDYQFNDRVTLSARYRITQTDIPDSGLGGFNLAESADHAHTLAQTVQFVATDVLNEHAVDETRFQFFNLGNSMVAAHSGASIQVLNAFTGGASPVGNSSDDQRNFELQNIATLTQAAMVWHFGGRLRATIERNISQLNFNGVFVFGGGTAPELDAGNQIVKDAGGNPVMTALSSIQQYQRTLLLQKAGLSTAQVQTLGGGATQFDLSAGNPLVTLSQLDAGLFVGNTWKVRPNLTVDTGLRFEMQDNIHDRGSWAPRAAASWSPAISRQKLVLRAGFGVFYDRFAIAHTLNAQRYNGLNQQQYVVGNPGFFPNVPSAAGLAASLQGQVIEQNAANLQAPYLMQTLLSMEQQLPLHTVVALSYSNSRGLHQLRSQDINAPTASGGAYPLGNSNPVFQVQSLGLFKQNQFIVNASSQPGRNISLFASYTYGKAMSNTDGAGTFPANPYSMAGEYGPASTDVRNFETFGGTIQSLWKTSFSPLLTVRSGSPFNITVGRDLYGTTLFNGRPGIATDPSRTGVIQTHYGLLDPSPTASETLLSRNFGRGPGSLQLNLRAGKTFGFGKTKGEKDQPEKPRYGLICTLQMRNLLNHNNPGPIVGNIASSLFGKANQAAGSSTQTGTQMSESATNRRFELQMRFTF